eukprot:TRINITY_DN4681_c0_g1_i1.p2 TRINITY_DN4681_c0_g1~~TRINITY_DN4681_c0_g1_i1.p2  ORF type:complete len:69 (-),score=21.20 TRINITY_DN4681_c0_g1_i1:27-233(-)
MLVWLADFYGCNKNDFHSFLDNDYRKKERLEKVEIRFLPCGARTTYSSFVISHSNGKKEKVPTAWPLV